LKSHNCPNCENAGKKVRTVTVRTLVTDQVADGEYMACLTEDCPVVYYNGDNIYYQKDLNVQVWYKADSDDESPVCYCSNLTRTEIKATVAKGYDTPAEIREQNGKTTTGNCIRENPLGSCCHNALIDEIKKYK